MRPLTPSSVFAQYVSGNVMYSKLMNANYLKIREKMGCIDWGNYRSEIEWKGVTQERAVKSKINNYSSVPLAAS